MTRRLRLRNLAGETPQTCGAELLEDLIYSFLLQSDYPRASVIFDVDLLGPSALPGAGMKVPSFVIVDPITADVLGVVEVVDAVDGDTLRQVAIETGAYASRLGGKTIQGFVVRVDVRGRTEAEQVQFYRIWPNSTLQQLTSKTFPDLDTLRVAKKLIESNSPGAKFADTEIIGLDDDEDEPLVETGPGAGMYLPALVLVILGVVDSYFRMSNGTSLLSVSQSILAFGAALLFTLPAAIRYLRR